MSASTCVVPHPVSVSLALLTLTATLISSFVLGFLRALISQLLQEDFICPPCLAQKVRLLTHFIRGDSYASITVGTPKYIANKMKSKGLQRLRWYCQVCEKQCRDENGFKCHAQSESHLRQMLVVGENAGTHIASFSSQFQSGFVSVLSRRYVHSIPINSSLKLILC